MLSLPSTSTTLPVTLEFQSKGLEQIEIASVPSSSSSRPSSSIHRTSSSTSTASLQSAVPKLDLDWNESWVSGTGVMVGQKAGWPLARGLEPATSTGDDTDQDATGDTVWGHRNKKIFFPVRVRFRVAIAHSRSAMETYLRSRRLHAILRDSHFPSLHLPHLIALWDSPQEGLWAVSEDRGQEILTSFWESRMRLGIAAAEKRWRARARAQMASGAGKPTLPRCQRSSELGSANGEEDEVDPLDDGQTFCKPTSLTHGALEGMKAYMGTPMDTNAIVEQKVRDYQEGLIAGMAERSGAPVQALLAQAHNGDGMGIVTQVRKQSTTSNSSTVRQEDLVVSLEEGYTEALQILLQIVGILEALHDRRLAMVICRPDFFSVETSAIPAHTPESNELPELPQFRVILTRLSTAMEMGAGRQPAETLAGPAHGLRRADTSSRVPGLLFSTNGSDRSPDATGEAGTAQSVLDSVYSEDTIRAHLRYIAPEALSSTQVAGPLVDIFSFGVLAYELLSGKQIEEETLSKEDLLVDLHRHATRKVTQLVHYIPSIPIELCDIIKACVSLDPEDRYTDCASLKYDLKQIERICKGELAGEAREQYQPIRMDRLSRFRFPQQIVQRETELGQIEEVYARVRTAGRSEAVAVYGRSGEGKSKLVETFARKQESSGNGLVGWAKADQHLVKPLSAFIQLFESLLDRVFSDPNEDIESWTTKLREGVTGNGLPIVWLLHRHWQEVILGDAAATEDAHRDQDWDAFSKTFRNGAVGLLSLFATDARPLILVQDDVQWQTTEEKALWVDILDGFKGLRNTLLLCSYRTPNDAPPALGFSRISMIRATPLTSNSLAHILMRSFHITAVEASVHPWTILSHFVLSATSGNAFYISTLLSTLVRDKAIFFDWKNARWSLSLDMLPSYAVEGVEAFTAQVLSTISDDAKTILRILACLPSRGVSLALLSRLSGRTLASTRLLLDEAVVLGVVRSDGNTVVYTHDRNHAAALRLIQEDEIPLFYTMIASQLESEGSQDFLFLRADMSLAAYNSGYKGTSPYKICSLVLSAARKAVRSAAFDLARSYTEKATLLVDTTSPEVWNEAPKLAMEFLHVEAEVAACVRRPADVIDKLRRGLDHVTDKASRIEIMTLCFRTLVAMVSLQEAIEMIRQAFLVVGIDIDDPKVDSSSVPQTPEALFAKMDQHRELTSLTEEDAIARQLCNLISFAGPTIYIRFSDHGRKIFNCTLAILFNHPAILPCQIACYPMAIQAVMLADDLNWDLARAYRKAAKSIDVVGTIFHPAIEIVYASLLYLNVSNLDEVDYAETYKLSIQLAQDTVLVYTGSLAMSTGRLKGRSLSQQHEEGKLSWDLVKDSGMPGMDRFALASGLQLLENLCSKGRPIRDLCVLAGSYLAPGEAESYLNRGYGYFDAAYWICRLEVALFLDAPPSELEVTVKQAQAHENGVIGVVMAHELGLILSVYELLRDDLAEPVMYRGERAIDRTIQTLETFPQNADYRAHRLMVLALKDLQDMRKGKKTWHETLPIVDEAVSSAQQVKNHLMAGFICRAAARSFGTISPRIVKGYVVEAFTEFKKCDAFGLARHIAEQYPDTVTLSNAWATASEMRDKQPDMLRSEPSLSTPSTDPDGLNFSEENAITTKEMTTRERLSLESILRSFLILASERNSDRLISKVCEVLMMINRSDFACMALCDPATQELCLRGVGTHDKFSTVNVPVNAAANICPSSVLLHAAHLKRATLLEQRLLERDPFFKNQVPKSVLLVPLTIQGRYIGCIMLSSKVPGVTPAAHSQIGLLGTFAAIVLESHSTTETLEKAVRHRTEQYQAANAHKSTFLSNVSHELRTPLHSINGLAVIMANSADMPASQRDNLTLITNAAEDLLRVINAVLDWSKIESNSLQVEAMPFSLRETVEGSLDAIAHMAHAKDLELILSTTVDQDPPVVIGDGHRLRQALLNLLSNSIKFTRKGSIRIGWRVEAARGDALRIRLDVKDTGLGIPKDKASKLFQSFSQVDSSTSRVYGGAGLGLAIVKGLANLMGGDCWLDESDEGAGSTFALTFEVRLEPGADKSQTADVNLAGPARRALILSPRDLSATAGNLRAFGVETMVMTNLDSYLLDSATVDFVFLDVNSFKMEAVTIKELQGKQPGAKFFYLVSLFDMTATIERFGMSHTEVITLPAKASALLQAIRSPESRGPEAYKQTIKKRTLIDKGLAQRCPMNILFVDDSLVNLGVGVKILNKYGYSNVKSASNGELAVQATEQEEFDLIFMDLQMPVMDGYTATAKINTDKTADNPLICALTANGDQSTKDRCIASGFSYFLSKPLEVPALAEVLQRAYQDRKGAAFEGSPASS